MNLLGIGLLLFQAQLATASGVVTKAGGAEPLPGATVILSPSTLPQGGRVNPANTTQAARIRSTISEDDGRFALSDIEPGEYRLQVQSPLFGAAAYGQLRPDGPGAVLTIAPGQRVADLKVSMVPTGTIAGRVTGRGGEPLAHATVQALKYAYQEGKRTLSMVQATTTDERGEYRLFWLFSGRYVVVAAPLSTPISPGFVNPPLRPGGTVLASDSPFRIPEIITGQASGALLDGTNLVTRLFPDGSIREESWMPTYYPATTDRALATPVDVAAGSSTGSTVTGIDITLGPSPVQKIRGRVSGGVQVRVTLVASSQGTNGRLINANASPMDGSFEFVGVVPGTYSVSAVDQAGLVSTPLAVLVADRDVENLSISLAPPVRLSARFTAEGLPPGTVDPFYALSGTLRPEFDAVPRATLGQLRALLTSGNTISWPNVPPGNYQLSIERIVTRENLPNFHIKSIRFGREDAFETIRVAPDTTEPLEVVLTAETGSVEGRALGRSGDPAGNVTVVLVPTNARTRAALYKTLVTGSDGKFRFEGIPPGDYKLFAWNDIETGAWQDAEFIRPFEARGRAVRVSEKSNEEVPLNVIYNP